jgi:hypothetical protein
MSTPCQPAPIRVLLHPNRTAVRITGADDSHRHDSADPLSVAWAVGRTVRERDFDADLEVEDIAERAAANGFPPDALNLVTDRFPTLRAMMRDDGPEADDLREHEDDSEAADAIAAHLAALKADPPAPTWDDLCAAFAGYVTERREEVRS